MNTISTRSYFKVKVKLHRNCKTTFSTLIRFRSPVYFLSSLYKSLVIWVFSPSIWIIVISETQIITDSREQLVCADDWVIELFCFPGFIDKGERGNAGRLVNLDTIFFMSGMIVKNHEPGFTCIILHGVMSDWDNRSRKALFWRVSGFTTFV